MLIGTTLMVLFFVQSARGKEYSYLFENLDSGKFPLAGIYTVGYAWSVKGPFPLKGEIASDLRSQATILYEKQYAEFYASVTWAQTISFVHFLLTLTFLLAGLLYSMSLFIILIGCVFSLVAAVFFLQQMKQDLDGRTTKLEAQLPEVVSTMAILVNSGMVLKDAWCLIAENNDGEFFDMMKEAVVNMNNGRSDAEAIFLFGTVSNSPEIKKFVSALIQSMEKGGAELSVFLANQSSELWKMKRQYMLQAGEKAATKLLAPIVLIFIGVMIIIMSAALMGALV